MKNFFKSQVLCVLYVPTTNAVVFHPVDGRILIIANIKVIDKNFFSCSWEEKLSLCWFMLLRPEPLVNDRLGDIRQPLNSGFTLIKIFFPASSFKNKYELSIKKHMVYRNYFIYTFLKCLFIFIEGSFWFLAKIWVKQQGGDTLQLILWAAFKYHGGKQSSRDRDLVNEYSRVYCFSSSWKNI